MNVQRSKSRVRRLVIALAAAGAAAGAVAAGSNDVTRAAGKAADTNAAVQAQAKTDAPPTTFTKQQVERRLRELRGLYERGLLTKEFYDRKVKECEVTE
jgi:hypothetical protein